MKINVVFGSSTEDRYIGLAADLEAIQDDVVGDEQGEDTETETPVNQGVAVMRSAPTNRIFIEQKGKYFVVEIPDVKDGVSTHA